MSPNFDSLYLWKNSSSPLFVIHIQKRLDLLFHLVFLKVVLCSENHTQIAFFPLLPDKGSLEMLAYHLVSYIQ